MEEIIRLSPGQYQKVKLGFAKSVHLVYCGMPNKDTFSVGYFKSEGYQGYGLNLYYPKNVNIITINKREFRVHEVSPEKLVIEQYFKNDL
jgi:hypothetical protein